ncbi:MAG: XdhC family protein [Desulfobacter sp.]|nr:XdhC family protein [Desulfobacter sp.]
MTSLIKTALTHLKEATPFSIATIISHQGSTPRTSGSKMLVLNAHFISGTIGGGLVEARVIEACVGLMNRETSKNQSQILDFTLDQEIKQGMDMACGGSLTVWIQTFMPLFSDFLIPIYERLADLERRGQKGLVITRRQAKGSADICLFFDKDKFLGPPILPKALIEAALDNQFSGTGPFRRVYGLEEFIIEPLAPKDKLFIFGAGHVGLQLGKMAHLTEFSCVVIDDRAEFANAQRFPHADEVHVVEQFSQSFETLNIDSNAYIVILTRGHLHDQVVLEQALTTSASYIGMIGSKKKREQIYANLMKKGIKKERLNQVYSPIGLRLPGETPAEIAVSIIGELITVPLCQHRCRLN